MANHSKRGKRRRAVELLDQPSVPVAGGLEDGPIPLTGYAAAAELFEQIDFESDFYAVGRSGLGDGALDAILHGMVLPTQNRSRLVGIIKFEAVAEFSVKQERVVDGQFSDTETPARHLPPAPMDEAADDRIPFTTIAAVLSPWRTTKGENGCLLTRPHPHAMFGG